MQIAELAKSEFDSLLKGNDSLQWDIVMDQSDYINMTVDNAIQNIWMGVLFAAIVLFLFLRDLGAVAPGVHRLFFDAAVRLGLGHVTQLDEAALGAADQPHLCQLFLQPLVLLTQEQQAVVAGGGHVHGLHK